MTHCSVQCHQEERLCNGEAEKMDAWRAAGLVDRGGTRDDIDGRYKRRLYVTTEAHAGIWGLHCHRKPC